MRRGVRIVVACVLIALIAAVPALLGDAVAGSAARDTPHLTSRSEIRIQSDADFVPANGVIGGTGTSADPYRIEGWLIGSQYMPAISVSNTSARFVIRDTGLQSVLGYHEGILLRNVTGARIDNTTFASFPTAVSIQNSRDVLLNGSRMMYSGRGIVVDTDTNVTVSGNTMYSGGAEGISVTSSSRVTVTRNGVSNFSGAGVSVVGSDWVNVTSNTLTWTRGGVILSLAANATVDDNRLDGGYASPLSVDQSDTVTLRRNLITNNPVGLPIQSSRWIRLEGNSMPWSGLYLTGSVREHYTTHVITPDNTVNGLPIRYSAGCSDLVIDREAVAQVFLAGCSRVRLSNLAFANVTQGVLAAFVDSLAVEGSNFTGTRGIVFYEVTNASITGDTFRYQGFPVTLTNSKGVRVDHNNFIRNSFAPAVAGSTNISWDAGYPSGGNYWSDYEGPDRCSGPSQSVCPDPDGIGDVSHHASLNVVDFFPLRRPYGIPGTPPIIDIRVISDPAVAGEWTVFTSDFANDPDGVITWFAWDFGDGSTSTSGSRTEYHMYARTGTFPISLTATDNSGLTSSISRNLTVVAPYVRPIPAFSITPAGGYVGERFRFNASFSTDPWGTIVAYRWAFDDGGVAVGMLVEYAFSIPGIHIVRLTVENDRGVTDFVQRTVEVLPFPTFRPYEHASGFRLLVPEWSMIEDQRVGDEVIETQLFGPAFAGVRTTVVIDTSENADVRETDAYLRQVVNTTMADLRARFSNPILLSLEFRRVSNHSAVSFEVDIPSRSLMQRVVIVVSEAHLRQWTLVLSVDRDYYLGFNGTFETMVDSFEVTLAPLPRPLPGPGVEALVAFVASVGVAVLLALFLVVRHRRRNPAPQSPPGARGTPPSTCPACGHVEVPDGIYCSRCGTTLRTSAVTQAAPASSREPPPSGGIV